MPSDRKLSIFIEPSRIAATPLEYETKSEGLAFLIREACKEYEENGPLAMRDDKLALRTTYLSAHTSKRLDHVQSAHPGRPLAAVIRALLTRRGL